MATQHPPILREVSPALPDSVPYRCLDIWNQRDKHLHSSFNDCVTKFVMIPFHIITSVPAFT